MAQGPWGQSERRPLCTRRSTCSAWIKFTEFALNGKANFKSIFEIGPFWFESLNIVLLSFGSARLPSSWFARQTLQPSLPSTKPKNFFGRPSDEADSEGTAVLVKRPTCEPSGTALMTLTKCSLKSGFWLRIPGRSASWLEEVAWTGPYLAGTDERRCYQGSSMPSGWSLFRLIGRTRLE